MIGIYIVGLTAFIHAIWAIDFLVSGSELHDSTPVAGFWLLCPNQMILGFILMLAAILAVGSRVIFRETWVTLMCMMPQQFLILISGYVCFHSIMTGIYPNGTIRPPEFILASQAPTISVALFHTAYVVALHVVVMNRWYIKWRSK